MRRPMLTLASLGAAVSIAGLAGIFAVTSDTATTGQNHADTGEYVASTTTTSSTTPPPARDALLLAMGQFNGDTSACPDPLGPPSTNPDVPRGVSTAYTPDLNSALFEIEAGSSDAEADRQAVLCVYNNSGESNLPLELLVPDTAGLPFLDVELTCGPGEATADATCEPGAPGELANTIALRIDTEVCAFDHLNRPGQPGTCTPDDPRIPPGARRSSNPPLMPLSQLLHYPVTLTGPNSVPEPFGVVAVVIQLRRFAPSVVTQTDRASWYFQIRTPSSN